MKRYTKKQFLADVAKEAKALKKNATKEEIDQLNFETFNPDKIRSCIYGQVTGDCRSSRATELITNCCKRFFKNTIHASFRKGMSSISVNVNGAKSEEPASVLYLSSIESYILQPFAKNKNLIAYLKGERKDLVL